MTLHFRISQNRARRRAATNVALASLASLVALVGASGCAASADAPTETLGSTSSALSAVDVLGFESPSSWTVSSGRVASTSTHTQGASALSVTAPVNFTTLVSSKLASSLAGLSALTDAGASILVDLQLPTSQPNPNYFGALQIYVNAPAEGVFSQFLGDTELTGQPLGVFQTYSFPVSSFVRQQLLGKSFSDLTITVALNAPAGAQGTYIFDNIRTTSAAAAPVGTGPSVDLTATLTQNPTVNTPGTASFAAGTIQIPSSFHVNAGDAGSGTATLGLGLGSASVTCTYSASADKTAYVFKSCSTSNVAGDIVAASFAQLKIVAADPAAPLTKVKAQLAYDAVGDRVGTKLLPPIPTFWGTTPADISAISLAFAQAVANAPPAQETFGTLPVPDFAVRHGDGSPVDTSNGQPPPPNDPPFNKSGHLNNGGSFDAYWQLQGNFSTTSANNDFTTALSTTAAVHAVIFGDDVTVADMQWTSNTDTGTLTLSGFNGGSASATVLSHLFGQQVESGSLTGPGSLTVFPHVHTQQGFSVPVFSVWVFSVSVGLDGILDIQTTGSVSTNGEQIKLTPSVAVGATFTGSVNVGFASGSVKATVELINVATPVTAGATWSVNQMPGTCKATLDADVNGQLTLSSLGGNVGLTATLGSCPFCVHHTFTLFNWTGVTLATQSIFDIPITGQTVPLSPSLCPTLPLTVVIQTPSPGTTVLAGTSVPVSATATRPANPGSGQPPTPVDCQFITWSSSDPGATFSSTTGCTPTVTFSAAAAGTTQTLTATAADALGDTGSAQVTVDVASSQQLGPVVQILSSSPAQPVWDRPLTIQVQVTEVAPPGPTGQAITLSCTDSFAFGPNGPVTQPFGGTSTTIDTPSGGTTVTTVTLTDIPGIPGGDESHEFGEGNNTITCTATDANQVTSQNSITFFLNHLIQ